MELAAAKRALGLAERGSPALREAVTGVLRSAENFQLLAVGRSDCGKRPAPAQK